MTTLYLNVIAGGILIGIVYALIALELTIIFGVMRHREFRSRRDGGHRYVCRILDLVADQDSALDDRAGSCARIIRFGIRATALPS